MTRLAAPRIYDALAALGQASEPELVKTVGTAKSTMRAALTRLSAEGVVLPIEGSVMRSTGKPAKLYRLVAGASRPGDVLAPQSVDSPPDEMPADDDSLPIGIVPRALAVAMRDPLVRWVRGKAVA